MGPQPPAGRLAEEVRRIGLQAGLDAVGIAPATPFADTQRHLEERRAAGLHGGMAFTYRNPARSTDPGRIVPGAAAIVVGARRYPSRRPVGAVERRPGASGGHADGGAGEDGQGEARRLDGGAGENEPGGPGRPDSGAAEIEPSGEGGARGAGRPDGRAAENEPARTRRPDGGAAENEPARTRRPEGVVARYASADYYQPLRRALGAVADRLRQDGWRAVVVADDNALVDREAAHRAGLGWYGKNTNLLLPGQGSWFVLGSVVTNAPLPASTEPVPDGCGACRRCLPACPTGALVAPGVLDARRCLAWLVQAPGVFPHEYREALGGRLYGCDDCQEVCPENLVADRAARAAGTGVGGFDPVPAAGVGGFDPGPADHPTVDLLALLAASDAELMDRHGRWYIPGRQPRYLRRNALIALGNVAGRATGEVEGALRAALADPDPLIRGHAVWAAARLGRGDLAAGLAGDPDPGVRREVQMAGADLT